jgi:hypothetical protein
VRLLQHVGAEGEEVEFAFAANVDEAGGFELLDVVGEGGGGDGQGGAGLSAAQSGQPALAMLLRHFKQGPGVLLIETVDCAVVDNRIGEGIVIHPRRAMGKAGLGLVKFRSGLPVFR